MYSVDVSNDKGKVTVHAMKAYKGTVYIYIYSSIHS